MNKLLNIILVLTTSIVINCCNTHAITNYYDKITYGYQFSETNNKNYILQDNILKKYNNNSNSKIKHINLPRIIYPTNAIVLQGNRSSSPVILELNKNNRPKYISQIIVSKSDIKIIKPNNWKKNTKTNEHIEYNKDKYEEEHKKYLEE